jgi:uncharacterized membrane protein
MVWSVIFSGAIGVMCGLITSGGIGHGEIGLSMGVTCGYTVAFCQRSASRLWLFIGQVAAMCLPMILAFALTDRDHAQVFEFVLVALVIVAVILGFAELCGILGDGVNQAADLISDATSIPSLNFTPLMTFGN